MKQIAIALVLLACPLLAADIPVEVSSAAQAIERYSDESEVRLLNVWATWCAPCVAEMNDLEQLHQMYAASGLEVLGISMDDILSEDREARKAKVVRFLASRSISFQNFYYTGKAVTLADELGFEGEIPITILYDKTGREAYRVEGAINRADLETKIRSLINTTR